jgi:hypothetical protein
MQRFVRVQPYLAGRAPTPTYTLQDLERRTGLKRRTLQSWGDNRVIVPDADSLHGGRGAPRLYSVTELIIAVLLAPFADAGFTVGYLMRIAHILRQGLDVRQAGAAVAMFEPGSLEIGRALVRALAGEGQNFLFFATDREAIFICTATDEGEAGSAGEPISFDPLKMVSGAAQPPRFGFWIDLSVIRGLVPLPPKP